MARRGGKRAAAPIDDDDDDSSDEVQVTKKGKFTIEKCFPTQHPSDMTAGKIIRMNLQNVMCHDNLEVVFNKNVNFIIGKNGSGKSAILSALTIGLGARTSVTDRGSSVKELIKTGCDRAKISITLSNVGPNAYKPDWFGDTIKVVRQIGSSSSYKLLNSRNQMVSQKKRMLENILSTFNIQVENPICILNQEAAKSFLKASEENKKYELFMKATQLETIGRNYKEAVTASHMSAESLEATNELLKDSQKEIAKLEEKIRIVNQLDGAREECEHLKHEYEWSLAIIEEKKLLDAENRVNHYEERYKSCENDNENTGDKIKEISEKIENLNSQHDEIDADLASSKAKFSEMKDMIAQKRDEVNTKQRLCQKNKAKIAQIRHDIKSLEVVIKDIEQSNDKLENRKRMETELEILRKELDDIVAMKKTKDNEKIQFENNKLKVSENRTAKKRQLDEITNEINKKTTKISNMQKEAGDNTSIYGRNYPRLIKRIDEEYRKRRFKAKPVGPIGAFMKINDKNWTPAVEFFLGRGFLGGFCVDNGEDKKVLEKIIREVFHQDTPPTLITSQFFNKVHDVRQTCVKSGKYYSLLESIEIENSVVANCFIDNYNPENILLIPTSEEAKGIMSKAANVPKNCRRALTQKGDTFFPDPNYRTYGGRAEKYARYLQVSTRDAIKNLNDEVISKRAIQSQYANEYDELNQNFLLVQEQFNEVEKKLKVLNNLKYTLDKKIEDITDKLSEVSDEQNVDVFKSDIRDNEQQLAEEIAKKEAIENEMEEMNAAIDNLVKESQEYRNNSNKYKYQMSKIKQEIVELKAERDKIQRNIKSVNQKLIDIKSHCDAAVQVYEEQKARTEVAIENAQNFSDRINSKRLPNEIKNSIKELECKIRRCEEKYGPIEALEQKLNEKMEKCEEIINKFNYINQINEEHRVRVEQRKADYKQMKKKMAAKIKYSFLSIIQLRNYTGTIDINHADKKLFIRVSPRSKNNSGQASQVNTLSGGERSYSTVAFILALWECSSLPFFFLDEFDVFMDNVNRRTVFEILLDHAKLHPERQYGFLTPLDASLIKVTPFITIHQLAAPERQNQAAQNSDQN